MKQMPEIDPYLVRGLERGIKVMQAFTTDRPEMTLTQIAGQVGVSRSVVYRTVYTLHALGILLLDNTRKTYSLGPAVLGLGYGYIATREVVEVARPELERLRDRTGWSAHLGILHGVSVLYVLRISAQDGRTSIVHIGSRLPARATSLGRVLLSDMSEPQIAALYRRSGGVSAQAMAVVLRHAEHDRQMGTVTHVGDFEDGIAAVAAPVRDMTGAVVAAINVSAPTSEISVESIGTEIREEVLDSAQRISRLLGAAAG